MEQDNWVIDIAEDNTINDEHDSTSEFTAVLIESIRGEENLLSKTKNFTSAANVLREENMLPSARDFARSATRGDDMFSNHKDFTRTADIFHTEGVQCLPPLIVHKRPWPGPLPTTHTMQRIRSKSFDVPRVVVTAESREDTNEMLQKTLVKPGIQHSHLNVSLPILTEKGRLTPPRVDNSSKATYQPALRRRSTSYVTLPKLSLNKIEPKKEDGS